MYIALFVFLMWLAGTIGFAAAVIGAGFMYCADNKKHYTSMFTEVKDISVREILQEVPLYVFGLLFAPITLLCGLFTIIFGLFMYISETPTAQNFLNKKPFAGDTNE